MTINIDKFINQLDAQPVFMTADTSLFNGFGTDDYHQLSFAVDGITISADRLITLADAKVTTDGIMQNASTSQNMSIATFKHNLAIVVY